MMDRVEVAQESYRVLRARFRVSALKLLRRRENLPEHDGERYLIGDRRVGLVIGAQKGTGAGRSVAGGFDMAAADTSFDLYIVNPVDLAREIVDLDRDAEILEKSERVRFAGVETGFGITDETLGDEEKLLEWTAAVNEAIS